jgi:hypothetical protein
MLPINGEKSFLNLISSFKLTPSASKFRAILELANAFEVFLKGYVL